jgi:DNA topoisomerase-1
LDRIRSLAIPPAWRDVWICRDGKGHIQAIGTDEAGRRQYIYHERWHAISSATKFDRMHLFAQLLPRIRRRLRKDLTQRKLTKSRVLAAVVRVLDKGHLRVGTRRNAEHRGVHGATTLTESHVQVDQFRVQLDFPGKGRKHRETEFYDGKTAKVIRGCQELEGQYLFCYVDEATDSVRPIHSTDVNEYLRQISDESLTAKDFRTWWGSTIALAELADEPLPASQRDRKRAVVAAIDRAAQELGNTRAVCRDSYIHPGLLAAAESGELRALIEKARRRGKDLSELTRHESLLANLLRYLDF